MCIGSILSPLTNDVRIFYGIEYLDWKYITPFPSNINAFWEIKPIGNHLVNYFLVVVTNVFIPFQNHFAQEILIKAIAVGIAIFACWLFSRNVLKIKYGFLLSLFGMLCCLNLNTLQAEWWAIVFTMIACALFMENRNYWHYIAGALLIMILLVKGTTGCLIVCAVCTVLIFNKHIDWIRGSVGFVVTGASFYLASVFVWKSMISDILVAPILSHVGEYDWFGQIGVTLIAITIAMSVYIPAIGVGLTYSLIWIKNNFNKIESKLLIISYLICLATVWWQNESFAYQYYIFLIPALTGLVLYERDTPRERPNKKFKRENILAATILILFAMYCILYSPQGSWGLEQNYGKQELQMNTYFWQNSNAIESKFNLSKEESILYLDTGSAPYYLGVNSSCRYVAPLILQRANPNRMVVSNLSEYWNAYICTMDYQGRYILADGPLGKADGWFGTDTIEKKNIVEKVSREYKEVFSGAWSLYERKNENEISNLT